MLASATSICLVAATTGALATAQQTTPPCPTAERVCLLARLETLAATIDQQKWRDRTLRELAKTLAFDGHTDRALAQMRLIENPDTRAMAIRGIGMAVAERKTPAPDRDTIYTALRKEAELIAHAPSRAIALTYVAMAQAFAGDDEAARQTALTMENPALRHKALGETAEIEAQRGDIDQLKRSLAAIDDATYRSKSTLTVVKILARGRHFDAAAALVQTIANPTLQTEGVQFILDQQVPREPPRDLQRIGEEGDAP